MDAGIFVLGCVVGFLTLAVPAIITREASPRTGQNAQGIAIIVIAAIATLFVMFGR